MINQLNNINIKLLISWAFLFGGPLLYSQSYQIDIKESSLKWIATKITGKHEGFVKIKNGNLELSNNKLSGKFIIDMPTIAVSDIKNEKKNTKLVNHLKDEDFFFVNKFPEASFVINKGFSTKKTTDKSATHTIEGVLTIKGISHPIFFPVEIKKSDAGLQASAKISIDRTKWDIKYHSTNFFKNLGDKAIDDMIVFEVILQTHPSKK